MDKQTKTKFEASRASQRLGGRWRIWEGFQGKVGRDSSYTDNMSMIFQIENLEDLGYLFINTSYSKPSNFFYNLKDQTVKKYIPSGYMLEVSV